MVLKIAFATDEGEGLEAKIASRFARSKNITFVEVNENWDIVKVETVPNEIGAVGGGAGVRVSQYLHEKGVNVAVGPSFGPNAAAVLAELGIKTVTVPPRIKVKDALKDVKEKV